MEEASLMDLRRSVREVCREFPSSYWREKDQRREYPEEFVARLSELGYLAAVIPEAYGGLGLGVAEASVVVEEVHRSGGSAASFHGQLYAVNILVRHASAAMKERCLPRLASGELRLQAFAVTEPEAGSDTLAVRTQARRQGGGYRISGEKVFISRVRQSDWLLLLARTSPPPDGRRGKEGLSLFLVDVAEALAGGLTVRPIRTMVNHEANALVFEDVAVPAENLVGEEGQAFRYLFAGLNAERILIAAECIGDGHWFLETAAAHARTRRVFGRPIGQNQGVAFPLAHAYAHLRAADLMRWEAARRYDRGERVGEEANLAKLLAAEASWEAANAAMQTFGGYGLAVDSDVERKFRETRLYQIAPVSTNLVLAYLAERALGLPRSY